MKYQRLRDEMVKMQIEQRGVASQKVINAIRKIPRHLFVSEALMDQAYSDYPLPIGEQQTISQPYIVAEMTQELEIGSGSRVLEIGTGSGYQTAILAEIVSRVYSIERIHSLFIKSKKLLQKLNYRNIITKHSDGTTGWKEAGPFDAIIVTAGAPDVPDKLIHQLKVGGHMVIPVGESHSQKLLKLSKNSNGVHTKNLGGCRFVKLIGKFGWEN